METLEITENNIIGELVASDYRTAAVFQTFGIDFCCKGNRTILDVCEQRNIDPQILIEDILQVMQQNNDNNTDFQSWPIGLLADYIEKKHHHYVESKIAEIKPYLAKISRVHGDRHPELIEIEKLFNESAAELSAHMKKEELILFPFIKKMEDASKFGTPLAIPHFGSVENPVSMMKHEHVNEGERFEKIAALSNRYTPPADACNTYRVSFALLNEFEKDLHLHIHLENNILFPKAIAMEKKLNENS